MKKTRWNQAKQGETIKPLKLESLASVTGGSGHPSH
jgi:hypothetical protein